MDRPINMGFHIIDAAQAQSLNQWCDFGGLTGGLCGGYPLMGVKGVAIPTTFAAST
jgi:hypothetical protein